MNVPLRCLVCPALSREVRQRIEQYVQTTTIETVYGAFGCDPIDKLCQENDRRLRLLDENVDVLICDENGTHHCVNTNTCHTPCKVMSAMPFASVETAMSELEETKKPSECVSCKRRFANWAELTGFEADPPSAKRPRRLLRSTGRVKSVRFAHDMHR